MIRNIFKSPCLVKQCVLVNSIDNHEIVYQAETQAVRVYESPV